MVLKEYNVDEVLELLALNDLDWKSLKPVMLRKKLTTRLYGSLTVHWIMQMVKLNLVTSLVVQQSLLKA